MSGGFKRSQLFGVVGVIAVAVLCAAIAFLFGDGASPTAAMAAILAIVFTFVFVLMRLQRADIDAAEAVANVESIAPTMPVTDPAVADDNSLLAALATKPIDTGAVAAARQGVFAISRDQVGAGTKLAALIALAVVPWQLFQFIWSIVVIVPIIVAYTVYLAGKALMPGGTIDEAYSLSEPTMDALGLALIERPKISIELLRTRPGLQKRVTGAVVYAGTRHGRPVTVTIESAARTTTSVAAPSVPFELEARGKRLAPASSVPAGVEDVVARLSESDVWRDVSVIATAEGITVERRRGSINWMRDLWLAEHLAHAATGGG